MKDAEKHLTEVGREVVDRRRSTRPWPPNRPPIRLCSSCAPGNSRSFAATHASNGKAAETRAATVATDSSSSSSSTTMKTATKISARPEPSKRS